MCSKPAGSNATLRRPIMQSPKIDPSSESSGASADPLERDHLPQQAGLVEPGFESALLHGSQNERWRVRENSELQSDDSKPKVGEGQTKAGPPPAVGKAHNQHASSAIGRRAGQLGHVRIAADDPVHY